MAPLLLFLFIAVPLSEIYLLIKVGAWLGAIPTIGLVVFAAVLGALLLRWQGFSLIQRVRETMARGELPATEMFEGVLVLFSGVLLLVPGFLTDAVGLLFLVPWARRRFALWFLARQGVSGRPAGRTDTGGRRGPYTIEGEFRREDSSKKGHDGP